MVSLLSLALVGATWFGTIFLRPVVRTFVRRQAGANDIVGYIVVIGVGVNMLSVWLLEMKLLTHLFLGGVISFFLAALIALVASTEKPFRAETSVSPEAFQMIYDSLMMICDHLTTANRNFDSTGCSCGPMETSIATGLLLASTPTS